MLDPVAGRFVKEDPIGLAGGQNIFLYANGDPANYFDPIGLASQCINDENILIYRDDEKQTVTGFDDDGAKYYVDDNGNVFVDDGRIEDNYYDYSS